MPPISYTVAAIIPNESLAAEYAAWLPGHVGDVVKAGASSGQIVRIMDPAQPIRIESRYVFADRPAFDRYLADHAPTLRADGFKRFPPELGIQFQRQVGVIL
jgi:hypothetical protein